LTTKSIRQIRNPATVLSDRPSGVGPANGREWLRLRRADGCQSGRCRTTIGGGVGHAPSRDETMLLAVVAVAEEERTSFRGRLQDARNRQAASCSRAWASAARLQGN